MKQRIRGILAVLISLTLIIGFNLPTFAANTQTAAKWNISKSKTSTNLDKDMTSTVKLSLPSAEEQLTSEVCFVLDESSFSDTQTTALNLLNTLRNEVKANGAKVQVDIVGFKRAAYNHGSYDLATEYDKIEAAFKKQNSGGSNMHAGLLMAKEVLAKNASIPNSRKYMVLVSDGDTYLYCKNNDYNTPYSRSFIPVDKAKGTAYGGFYDESWYNPSQPYDSNIGRPSTSNADSWNKYLKDVEARNKESNGDAYDYVWKHYDGWQNMTSAQITADGFKTQPNNSRTASNMDMAFYYAANTYQELADKYNCYSVAVQSLNKKDGGHKAFMDYLNGGATADFSTIQNHILYLLGAGSTVEDYIGYEAGKYNFDLVDPANMTITLDNTTNGKTETYKAEKIGDNHYGFKKNDSGYDYEVTYVSGHKEADEHFIWKINVPVSNFQHVTLAYNVQLMNPKTKPGTYTGLFTNTSAILYPVDSAGHKGTEESFEKPEVSYTIAEPAKPDNNKPSSTNKTTKSSQKTQKPKTGDATNAVLPIALFSFAAATLAIILRKKNRA